MSSGIVITFRLPLTCTFNLGHDVKYGLLRDARRSQNNQNIFRLTADFPCFQTTMNRIQNSSSTATCVLGNTFKAVEDTRRAGAKVFMQLFSCSETVVAVLWPKLVLKQILFRMLEYIYWFRITSPSINHVYRKNHQQQLKYYPNSTNPPMDYIATSIGAKVYPSMTQKTAWVLKISHRDREYFVGRVRGRANTTNTTTMRNARTRT